MTKPSPTALRTLAICTLGIALFALWSGRTAPHTALFRVTEIGFILQALASAACLLGSFIRCRTGRATGPATGKNVRTDPRSQWEVSEVG